MKKTISLAIAGTLIAGAVGVSVIKPAREWVKETATSAVEIVRNFFTNEKDTKEISDLKGQVKILKEDKARLLADLTIKNSALINANAEISNYQTQLEFKNVKIAEKEEENTALKNQLSLLLINEENNATEISLLNNKITANETTINNLKNEKTTLNNAIEDLIEQRNALNTEIVSLNTQITDLSNLLASIEANGSTLMEAFKDYSFTINAKDKVIVLYEYLPQTVENGNLIIPDFSHYTGEEYTTNIFINVFYNKGISSVTFPERVECIGNSSFGNNSIKELKLPSTLIAIGDDAFRNNGLESLVIPENVVHIGQHAFSDNSISDLTLGASVQYILNHAFASNQLTKLILPESILNIAQYAFYGNNITSLILPDSLTGESRSSFAQSEINFMIFINHWGAEDTRSFFFGSPLEHLEIGLGLSFIGLNAFSNHRLREIHIPSNVKVIDNNAFIPNQYQLSPDYSITLICEDIQNLEIVEASPESGYIGVFNGVNSYSYYNEETLSDETYDLFYYVPDADIELYKSKFIDIADYIRPLSENPNYILE